MKAKPVQQIITANSLLRILSRASKSTTLSEITRLYVEKQRLKEAMRKLRDKQKQNTEALKTATTAKTPEQFMFKF